MKIGILTFWMSKDNYGQILQMYALQKYLKDAGHEVFLIRYNYFNDFPHTSLCKKIYDICNSKKLGIYLNPNFLPKYIINRIKNRIYNRLNERRCFNKFKENYIVQSKKIYNSYNELKSTPPEADIYIVGSDQVWNPKCLGDISNFDNNPLINAFFLNFGPSDIKKMSYAASWGTNSITDEYMNNVSYLLKQFSYVSVREKSGISLCKSFGVNAELVCDPTLLLTATDYRGIYKNEKRKNYKYPYIFLYLLNNTSTFDINELKKFANEKKLKIVTVSANGNYAIKSQVFPSIQEWLSLIDNAEYVVTNSFHCGIFSTIFNKKYGIIPLSGYYSSMNDRFLELFDRFSINHRFINDSDFSVLTCEYTSKLNLNNSFMKYI